MNFADERRASGRKMTEDRRASGRKMRDDLNSLAESSRAARPLPVLPLAGPAPSQRGVADWVAPVSTSGGGGIAGPLVETSIGLREYHASGMRSSDGLFVIPAIKAIYMDDANEDTVKFEYAAPIAPVVTP